MTHVFNERLKELAKDADREKALKEVANATAKEKLKAVSTAQKRTQSSKKAHLPVEEKVAEVEGWLEGVELKLAKAASLNLAQANQIADLRSALEAYENKWYDDSFVNAEKSAKPVVYQARLHRFKEGWLTALQVMGVPKDSPLRDLGQIPYPAPPPPSQSQVDAADEEEITSMRELVQAIDAHVDLKVSSNLQATENEQT